MSVGGNNGGDLLKNTWISSLQDAARASGVTQAPMETVRMNTPAFPISNTGMPSFFTAGMQGQYADPAVAPAPPKQWYTSPVFLQFVAVVAVFLLTFIVLISIRPPFLYTQPKEKLKEPEFSAKNTAWVSLATAVVAAAIMVALALTGKKHAGVKT